MGKAKLFSGINLYLLLASLLSLAMLFAPIAWASNFGNGMHARVFGGKMLLEQSLGNGLKLPTYFSIWQLPLNWPYVLVGLLMAGFCLRFILMRKNPSKKSLWISRLMILSFVHALLGVLIRLLASQHVGHSDLATNIESGFQREFFLHLFILYFLLRAWLKQKALIPTVEE